MTKTLRGTVHGKTIELNEDLGVLDGQEVEIQVTMLQPKAVGSTGRKTLAEQLGDLVGSVPDLPADMADQHDHYLHRAPKK